MRCLRLQSFMFAFVCLVAQIAAGKSGEIHFRLIKSGEAVPGIVRSAPGASWELKGNETAVAAVTVDGQYDQGVMIFGDGRSSAYRVVLRYLKAGPHTLQVERSVRWSALGPRLVVTGVRVRIVAPDSQEFLAVELAPILYACADTVGHFSDALRIVSP